MFKSGICVLASFVAIGVFVSVGAITGERYIGNAVHEDYPGMCYDRGTQKAIELYKSFKPETECAEYYCMEAYTIRVSSCPRYMIGEGCTVSFKEGAPYPECCANVECPKGH